MKKILDKTKDFFKKIWSFIKRVSVNKYYDLKKRFSMKQFIVVIATTIFSVLFIVLCNFDFPKSEFFSGFFETNTRFDAKVVEVGDTYYEDKTFLEGHDYDEDNLVPIISYRKTVVFKAEITKGPTKGEVIDAIQILHYAFDSWPEDKIKVGKKVILHDYNNSLVFFPSLKNLEEMPSAGVGKQMVQVVLDDDVFQYIEVDDEAVIPLNEITVPEKEGYVFEGFYFISPYSNFVDSTLMVDEEYSVDDDVTIVAGYSKVYDYIFLTYNRIINAIILGIILILCLLIIGGIKGFLTLLSLLFTVLGLFVVYVPAILSARNIYLWTIITCIFILVITVLYVVGANKKGLAAIISCSVGLLIGAILTVIVRHALNFTGYKDVREYQLLLYLDTPTTINLRAILFGAITVGALGAMMDIGISLTSALKEVNDQMTNPTFKQTVKSGFVIGRDIMGTMANTLLLAYIGSSLIFTVFLASHFNLQAIFTREDVVMELAQILIGTFTLLLTIPISIFVSAWLYNGILKDKKKESEEEVKDVEVETNE